MDDKRYRLLYVEDDQVDQMAFQRHMQQSQAICVCTVAGSVAEAKAKLGAERFDLVLTDYHLGDGTAVDVVKAAGQDIPVIFTTRQGGEQAAIEALKAGAYDHLVKDPERRYLQILSLTMVRTMRRKKAEIQSKLMSDAVRRVSDSVYMTDGEGRITYVNGAFCWIYGYKEDEARREEERAFWGAEDAKRLGSDKLPAEGEARHKRKDGGEFPVWYSRSIVKDEADKVIAIVGVTRPPEAAKAASEGGA